VSIDSSLRGRMGIYHILNTVTGVRYVGQSVNLFRRLNCHRNALCDGRHENKYLQRAFTKYGEESFSFGVLEFADSEEMLTPMEQRWLDALWPALLYNLAPSAGRSQAGIKRTPETCKRISEAKRGWKMSDAHKARLREFFTGRKMPPRSEEWRRKLSESKKGKPLSPHALKRAAQVNAGPRSAEFRAGCSERMRAAWARRRT
jgi:group I intron endonuclease